MRNERLFRTIALAACGALALLCSHQALATAGCINDPTTGLPDPKANPFYAVIQFGGGVDASNSAGKVLNLRRDTCTGEISEAGSRQRAGETRTGAVSVFARAGLSAGFSIDASFTGPALATGYGEIDLHQDVTPPVTSTTPVGKQVKGSFMLAIEGSNKVTIGNNGQAISVAEFDLYIKGRDKRSSWTDGVNQVPTTSLLVPLGPSPDPRRILYTIPGAMVAGETVSFDLTITADAQAYGSGPSQGHGPGSATVTQQFANTVSYAFVPDDPSVRVQWGSDPYFGGAQPSIQLSTVPWPPSMALMLAGLGVLYGALRSRRCRVGRSACQALPAWPAP